jgi:hypothetical protein
MLALGGEKLAALEPVVWGVDVGALRARVADRPDTRDARRRRQRGDPPRLRLRPPPVSR